MCGRVGYAFLGTFTYVSTRATHTHALPWSHAPSEAFARCQIAREIKRPIVAGIEETVDVCCAKLINHAVFFRNGHNYVTSVSLNERGALPAADIQLVAWQVLIFFLVTCE